MFERHARVWRRAVLFVAGCMLGGLAGSAVRASADIVYAPAAVCRGKPYYLEPSVSTGAMVNGSYTSQSPICGLYRYGTSSYDSNDNFTIQVYDGNDDPGVCVSCRIVRYLSGTSGSSSVVRYSTGLSYDTACPGDSTFTGVDDLTWVDHPWDEYSINSAWCTLPRWDDDPSAIRVLYVDQD
jgi:hypothetical protein